MESPDHELAKLEADVQLNLHRKTEAELAGDSPALIETFETRMNRSLDQWADLHRHLGKATLL